MIRFPIGASMKNHKSMGIKTVSVILLALLAGCGGESPEAMLASAKGYLAKNDTKAAVIQLKNALQSKPDLPEARFLLAKALLEEGNPAGAEVELRKAAELKYPSDEVVPARARAMLQLGQTKKVVDEFGTMKLSKPESAADLQTTVGRAYLALGQVDSAKSAFDAALVAVPDYGPAVFGQARVKASSRDFPGAMALLDSALAKDPNFLDARQFQGDLLTIQGNAKEASETYRKLLELRPDYVPAHLSLISRNMETGNLDDASKQFEALKKIAPANPQTSYIQAELLYRQKKYKEAREVVQQHLRAAPESVLGQQLAGAIEFELNSFATAEKHLLAVLQKTPELGLARRALIATYLRSGQPDKALGILQPILEKIDNNSNLLALAGEVFMQNGDAEKAGTYFSKAAALDPENKSKQTSLALSHLAKGETETAYRELEKISSTDSGIRADLALIAAQLRNRKFDDALKSVGALEKKQPENPLVDDLRGTALLGKREIGPARQSFEKSLQKNPAYFPAAANLARLDVAERKPDEAKKRFEGVLAKDAKNTQALLALAELMARTGAKPEEVGAQINQAVASNPIDISSRLALINFYLGAKEPKKAVSAAQDALVALPDNPAIVDAEGRAQQAAENFNQALSSYGRLASLLPHSIQPHLRMAEIHVAAKNKEAAMQSLRKALSIKPDSIEAQRGVMMLDLDAGRNSSAIATARNIQKQHPKNPAGYVLEGDAYALGKSWKEAAVAYRNGIKQTDASELAVKLHAVLAADNVPGEANRFADGWLKEHAKDDRFRLYLAEFAGARKDYPAAIKQYRTLLDSQPDNAALMNNLAWAMGQAKDPKAVELAEKAYKLAPEQANIVDTLGTLLVAKGDTERGVELMKKANKLAPANPAIKLNLAKAMIKAGSTADAKKELDELVALGDRFPDQGEVKELLQGLKP